MVSRGEASNSSAKSQEEHRVEALGYQAYPTSASTAGMVGVRVNETKMGRWEDVQLLAGDSSGGRGDAATFCWGALPPPRMVP
jgi:hypothetical protein